MDENQASPDSNEYAAAFAEFRGGTPQDESLAATTEVEKETPQAGNQSTEALASEDKTDEAAALVALLKEREAENKRLAHQAKSDSGRVAALQRELQRLKAGADQAKALAHSPEIDRIREDFPEVAAVMDSHNSRTANVLDNLAQSAASAMEPLAEQQKQVFIQNQYSELEKLAPGWQDDSSSPVFQQWLSSQNAAVVKAANSYDARDVALVIKLFRDDKKSAVAASASNSAEAAQLSKRREQQLSGATPLPSASSKKPDVAGDDYEAAHAYYLKKLRGQI